MYSIKLCYYFKFFRVKSFTEFALICYPVCFTVFNIPQHQEKVCSYAKELNIENLKAPDGWLHRWKEQSVSKKFLENQIPQHLKWLMLERKRHHQLYCPTTI